MISLEREGGGWHERSQCGSSTCSRVTPPHCGYWHTIGYSPEIGVITCPFCGEQAETQEYVFFSCRPMHQLWERIRYWLWMRYEMTSNRRMLQVFEL